MLAYMCAYGETKLRKGSCYVKETLHPFVCVCVCEREREREF